MMLAIKELLGGSLAITIFQGLEAIGMILLVFIVLALGQAAFTPKDDGDRMKRKGE